MAIEGTYVFNPDLGEIMEEAFEKAGASFEDAKHIKSARRSLNLIALEWQNKGINLWTIDEVTIPTTTIVAGTATYDVDLSTIGILDAVLRTNAGITASQSDLTMSEMSSTTYYQMTNKLTEGRPTQYWLNRKGVIAGSSGGTDVPSTVTLWPTPDKSNEYAFVYSRMRRISDMGSSIENTVDVPDRFIPVLIANLAFEMACKIPESMGRVDRLQSRFVFLWEEAAGEDRDKTDVLITPDMSAYR